jgi:protein CpxP
MIMKKMILVSMVLFCTIGIFVSAQEKDTAMEKKCPKHEMKGRAPLSAEQRMLLIAKELGLTEAEKTKVKALFEKQDEQRAKEHEEIEKKRKAEMAKIEAYKKAQDDELQKIIGKEKSEKLQLKRAEMQLKHKEHRGLENDSITKRKPKHSKLN